MTASQMVRARGALRSSLPAFCSPVGITSPTHTGACGQAGASPGLSAIHSQVAHRATSQPGDGVGGGDISRVHGQRSIKGHAHKMWPHHRVCTGAETTHTAVRPLGLACCLKRSGRFPARWKSEKETARNAYSLKGKNKTLITYQTHNRLPGN